MSNSKVSTIDSKYQRENNVNHNTNGPESIHNTGMQEVLKTGYSVEKNGEGGESVKISTNVAKSTMDSQETKIDIEIMKPNVSSGNILFAPRRLLKKLLLPQPYRKHTGNPYQGYPPPGAPPGAPPGYPPGYPPGNPSGYPPPPPGYPPGYPPPPPGYPPGYPPQGYPPPGAQQAPAGWNDDENHTVIYDPETRNIFIRKVLTIVLVMLIITAILVAVVLYVPILRSTFRKLALPLIITASALVIGANYALMCSPCSRTGPGGWFILFITCVAMSTMSAVISSHYRTEIVLFAVMATAGVVIVCLALACTKFDFTKYLLFFIVISSAVFITALIVMIFMLATGTYMKTVHLVILVVTVIVLAVGLVIEIQMVIGGKTVQLGEEEYTLAAFMLYTSIVHMFIQLVQIIGILNN